MQVWLSFTDKLSLTLVPVNAFSASEQHLSFTTSKHLKTSQRQVRIYKGGPTTDADWITCHKHKHHWYANLSNSPTLNKMMDQWNH